MRARALCREGSARPWSMAPSLATTSESSKRLPMSHPLRAGDPEEAEGVLQDYGGRLREGKARSPRLGVRGREHRAVRVEGAEFGGELERVLGEVVRRALPRAAAHQLGQLGHLLDERPLFLAEGYGPGVRLLRCLSQYAAGPEVSVLEVRARVPFHVERILPSEGYALLRAC